MTCRTIIFATCLLLVGCGNSETASSSAADGGSDVPPECTTHQEAPCTCDGGATGTKECVDASYGPCSCPQDIDSADGGEDVHDPADAPTDTEGAEAGHYGVWCGGHQCVFSVSHATALSCSIVNGKEVCDYVSCAQDFWDTDGDRSNGCEFMCIRFSDADATCDGIDDDCNGLVDDGIDFCSDIANCGKCGRTCGARPYASTTCASFGSPSTCNEANTQCEIESCSPGHIDANGIVGDGCEFACVKTKRTVPTEPSTLVFCDSATDPACGAEEYEDDIDNDCDGDIDEGLDPDINTCVTDYDVGSFPGDRQHCSRAVADPTTGVVSCFDPGPSPEVCDGIDNDCDGHIDEVGLQPDGINGSLFPGTSVHVGDQCGQFTGACDPGVLACVSGAPMCVGGVTPSPEQCDCEDNDCDGLVDEGSGPGDPPMCGEDKVCVRWNNQCECAAPCSSTQTCPTWSACEQPQISGSDPPESAGDRCVVAMP